MSAGKRSDVAAATIYTLEQIGKGEKCPSPDYTSPHHAGTRGPLHMEVKVRLQASLASRPCSCATSEDAATAPEPAEATFLPKSSLHQ
eukprot:g33925.t1